MRKELLRTLCASTIILCGSTILGQHSSYAQSADLTPIIINPEDVYKVNSEKPGNFYSKDYQNKVDLLEQENQNLHKVIKTMREDVDKKKLKGTQSNEDEVVNLKSNLYDLQHTNNELRSALDEATQKNNVLQSYVDKQKLNEKYLTHRLKNIDDEIDDRSKKKISKLKSQNITLKETIKTVNETLKQKEAELAAGQIQIDTVYGNQQEKIDVLTVSNEDLQKQIEVLQETVTGLKQDNSELIAEIKLLKTKDQTNDVVVTAKPSNKDLKDNVFFKKELLLVEEKESDDSLSSLELLKSDTKGSDIEYVRGEKEMIFGTSDRDHMEQTTKIETNYPPLEETTPRKIFNN